jgi:hypothetical protein
MISGMKAGAALAALGATIAPSVCYAQEAVAPEGWRSERKANGLSMTPGDLPAGKTFTAFVTDRQNLADADLAEWLTKRSDAAVAAIGEPAGDSTAPRRADAKGVEVYTRVQTVNAKTGGQAMVATIVARRPDGQAVSVLVISSPDQELTKKYLPDVVKTTYATLGTTSTSGGTRTTRSGDSPRRDDKPRPKRKDPREAYTRAGAGPKKSEIYGIYSHMTTSIGYGGGVYMIYEPIIVFNDGTFYEDFDVPLEDFDVSAARTARPKAWGKWRKQGGKLQVLNSKGVWEDEKWIGPLPPAKQNDRLSGKFSSTTGGGNTAFGGGTAFIAVSDIEFLPDGTFRTGKFVGMSSNEPSSDTSVVANSESSNRGQYTLSGYTLTLKFADGRVEKRAFAFMDPKTDRTAAYLNGSPYLIRDKKK